MSMSKVRIYELVAYLKINFVIEIQSWSFHFVSFSDACSDIRTFVKEMAFIGIGS